MFLIGWGFVHMDRPVWQATLIKSCETDWYRWVDRHMDSATGTCTGRLAGLTVKQDRYHRHHVWLHDQADCWDGGPKGCCRIFESWPTYFGINVKQLSDVAAVWIRRNQTGKSRRGRGERPDREGCRTVSVHQNNDSQMITAQWNHVEVCEVQVTFKTQTTAILYVSPPRPPPAEGL